MANAPRILIVTSRYYAHISAELEAGVVEGLEKVGATYEFLEVPGAFEIPAAIAMAAGTGEWDGFVALGCVLRGVFLGRQDEVVWFLDGLRRVFPDAWAAFSEHLPPEERGDLLGAYLRRLCDPDPAVHLPAARAWSQYEGSCSTL